MEWMAMIYLVVTQKGRRIEEILYDFNAEPIHENILHCLGTDHKCYRKKELLLQRLFVLLGGLSLAFLVGLVALSLFKFSLFIMMLSFFLMGVCLVFVGSFVWIVYSMQRYHKFEFKKTRNSMVLYFLLSAVIMAASIACFFQMGKMFQLGGCDQVQDIMAVLAYNCQI